MRTIFLVYKKELIEQLRDRRTLWLAILLPLLLIPALSLWLDHMSADVSSHPKIVVPMGTPKELQQEIARYTQFEVMEHANPLDQIKKGEAEAYLEPVQGQNRFRLHLPGGEAGDPSLLYPLKKYIDAKNQKGLQQPNAYSLEAVEAKGPDSLFSGFYLFSILLSIAPLVGGMNAAIDAIAGEKERRTILSLLTLPVRPQHLWIGKWLAVSTLTLFTMVIVIGAMLGIQPFLHQPVHLLSDLKQSPVAFQFALLGILILYVLLIAAVLLITSTFARSFKEAQSYFSPLMILVMACTFVLLQADTSQLPKQYFMVPILNVHALIYEMFRNTFSMSSLLITLGSSAVFIFLLVAIGAFLFRKPKYLLGS